MTEILRRVIARNRAGEAAAIPSVCSAHPEVLRACLMRAEVLDRPIVIEATSNQVNPDGGYTGLTPAGFVGFVGQIAAAAGVRRERIIFGGDHLGPQVWRKGAADAAMARARDMVTAYVQAGFAKIHLDCSQGCAGEPAQLGNALAAARAAELAQACHAAAADPGALLYVIGTEVPPPGGARKDEAAAIAPTTAASASATLAAHAAAFTRLGLVAEIGQIGGLVVQPGVEFSPMAVHHLPLARDPGLRAVLADWPQTCLEAHSTDYQHPAAYPRLAALGFAFQKVGPALTFAFRQAVYGLDTLCQMAGWASGASLCDTMERLMLADPGAWQGHYHGEDLRLQRHFGLADRIRYYWPQPEAKATVARLLADLQGRALPEALLRQVFAPAVLERADGLAMARPQALIAATIQLALDPYFFDAAPIAGVTTKTAGVRG